MTWSFGNLPLFPASPSAAQPAPWPIQAKLETGPVDHPLEREADDTANQIMRMPDSGGTILESNRCGKSPQNGEEGQKEGQKKMREKLAGKDLDGAFTAAAPAVPAIVRDVLNQPGLPLDAETRAFFEPRFGFDFSRVRVQTGPLAAQSASSISARAFTLGRDIVFNDGQYAPHSSVGRSLIAHELAHVVQQREGRAGASTIRRVEQPLAWFKMTGPAVLEVKRLLNLYHQQELAAGREGFGKDWQLLNEKSDWEYEGQMPPALLKFQNRQRLKHRDSKIWQETLDALRAATAPPAQQQESQSPTATSQPAPAATTETSPPTASSTAASQEELRSETNEPARPGQPPPISEPAGTPKLGTCKLRSGTMQWSLVPMVGYVNARIEFTPNAAVAASKTISFVQTLTEIQGERGFFAKPTISPTTIDFLARETDPFYGAQWDRAAGKWSAEPTFRSRPFTASTGSAVLNDTPQLGINNTKQFETVAVVVETGEVLGSLRWNINRSAGGGGFGLDWTSVERADCIEGASIDFPSVVERFYSDGYNIVLESFPAGSAALFGIHQQQLAPIVDRLRKNPALRVIVGGAATQDEPDPIALSRSRAESVRAYLVGEGVAESRIDVEAYGSDWARIPVNLPGTATANRRVQIRVSRP